MVFRRNPSCADPLFTRLRDRPELHRQRAFVETLCGRYRRYADKNFTTELPRQFVARFWEMFLACSLLDAGFNLLPRKDWRSAAGPDICIVEGSRRVWIEAVAPKVGSGPDAVQPLKPGWGWVPEEQIVLRFTSVIKTKHQAYQRYLALGLVDAAAPYLIAVNGAQIPNADIAFPDEVPYPIQAVLPIGAPSVTIDSATGTVVKQGFAHRPRIVKLSGTKISTKVFLDPSYSGISALIFSAVHPLRNAAGSVGALSLLHNPRAKPILMLPRGWLTGGVEWWVEADELHHRRIGSGA